MNGFSEAGQELLGREGGRSKFADNDGGAVIGNFGCFLQGASRAESQGEEGNGGIAGTRYVENLLGAGGGVIRRGLTVEKIIPCSLRVTSTERMANFSRRASLQLGAMRYPRVDRRMLPGRPFSAMAKASARFGLIVVTPSSAADCLGWDPR